jgi:hypothetical protein
LFFVDPAMSAAGKFGHSYGTTSVANDPEPTSPTDGLLQCNPDVFKASAGFTAPCARHSVDHYNA